MHHISLFEGFFSLIPQLIIFVATIMYITKNKEIDAILLFIGSLTGIIVRFIFSGFIPFLNSFDLPMIFNFIQLISVLGQIAFAIGLLLLIKSRLKDNFAD
jgi:hypothetical protein